MKNLPFFYRWFWIFLGVVIYYVINHLIHWPRIRNYGNRHVVITGCDTGFGNLLARRLDRLGFLVFAGCLTEKGRSDLDRETSPKLKTFSLDVTSVKSIQAAFEFVSENIPDGRGLWGLVNNAGIGVPYGPVEWLAREDYLKVMGVNLFGMIDMTRFFLPLLKKAKGRIVNTSSISGFLAVAGAAPYQISKYGVEAYSDSLRRQLRSSGIRVSMLEPGTYRTNIISESLLQSLRDKYEVQPDHVKQEFSPEYVNNVLDVLRRVTELTASDKLEQVIDAYEHALTARVPRSRYLVGYMARFGIRPISYLPTWLLDILLPCPFETPC